MTLTSPNSGEKWIIGKTYNIIWKSTGINKVTLYFTDLNIVCSSMPCIEGMCCGPCGNLIAKDVSASLGKYSWTIPASYGAISQSTVVIQEAVLSGNCLSDSSDSTFNIIKAECKTDSDCPQLDCSSMATDCYGVVYKCVDGKCVETSTCSSLEWRCSLTNQCVKKGETCCTGMPGGCIDEHGCNPTAGYTWCDSKQKCLRTWEEACLTPTPTPQPTGYYRNAYWQCYDGTEANEGGPTSCKSSETWRRYAEEFCSKHCTYCTDPSSSYCGGKCGVNTFKVWNECRSGTVCKVVVDCVAGYYPVDTGKEDGDGCPIIICEKEKPKYELTGCQTDDDCQVGGCSGELCYKKGLEIASICLWKPEYECLKKIGCKCVDNKCQWQKTSDFDECMAKITEAQENQLIKVPGKPDIYVIKNGKLQRIPSWKAFVASGYKIEEVKPVEEEEIVNRALVNLIRVPNDSKVYIIGGGLIRHIPSPEVFQSYGLKWGDIVTVSSSELKEYGQANLIRGIGEAKVYLIENGQKRWIETAEIFQKRGYDWSKIVEINKTELNVYSIGSNVKQESERLITKR